MNRYILSGIAVLSSAMAFGQLSGVKNIPGDYATITLAVADLNASGVGIGGVIFHIAAGHTETISQPVSVTASGTAANPILFQKSGSGANPLITAYAGTQNPGSTVQDGIWNLVGSDYVTIDGIDLTDPNAANPATMEYGFGLFRANASDGCQHDTIRNCTVTLKRINNATGTPPAMDGSRAINVVASQVTDQVTILIPSVAAGTNSFNCFYRNTLQNCNYGIAIFGYNAPSPFTLGDTGNDIGGSSAETGNSILNFGGSVPAANPSAGIRVKYQWGINIAYNTINNNNGSGVNHPNVLRGIYTEEGTSAGATIRFNNLTIKGGGTTHALYGIDNGIGSTSASNLIDLSGNTITGTYATATTGSYTAINNTATAFTVNINNNTIGGIVIPGSGALTGIKAGSPVNLNVNENSITGLAKSSSGYVFGIRTYTSVIQCNNNTIDGLSLNSTISTHAVYGIYNVESALTETYNDNIIRNITVTNAPFIAGIHISTANGNKTITGNQLYNFSTSGNGYIHGIYMYSGLTDNVSNNQVHDFSVNGTGTGARQVFGIRIGGGSTNTISGNNIYSLSCAAGTDGEIYGLYIITGATSYVYRNQIHNLQALGTLPLINGIYVSGGNAHHLYNNIVQDLRTPASNNSTPLVGIQVGGGTTLNLLHNTVYLSGTSTGAVFGSAALKANATPNLLLRNNILVNTSTPNGTGRAVAYWRESSSLTSYQSGSDANNYYAGAVEDDTHAVYYNGTSTYTMAGFQALVGPVRDSHSIRELPPFVSVASPPYDVHLQTGIPTGCESGGLAVTSPFAINNDFDGQTRQGYPGYSGSGSAPDIGADEFEGTSIQPLGISVTLSGETCRKKCDGMVALTVTGGISPYSFLWSNGTTESSVSGLCAGNYAVTVTDAGAVTETGNWDIASSATVCETLQVTGTITDTACYDATQALTVAGNGNTFIVENGGSVTLISGIRIQLLPGAAVQEGGYLLGHITTNATYCGPALNRLATSIPNEESTEAKPAGKNQSMKLFPNPTSGMIHIDLAPATPGQLAIITIFNIQGVVIHHARLTGKSECNFSLLGRPGGIYLVRVQSGERTDIVRIVKF